MLNSMRKRREREREKNIGFVTVSNLSVDGKVVTSSVVFAVKLRVRNGAWSDGYQSCFCLHQEHNKDLLS
jgi:hypothetical protein